MLRTLSIFSLACLLSSLGCAAKTPRYQVPDDLSVSDPRFSHVVASVLNSPLLPGNRVDTLINGDEIFPAMLEAIGSAEHTIAFETFVYWSGEVGEQFTQALCERARAGVAVHVTIDAVGSSKIDGDYLDKMEEAGIQVVMYHRLKWTHFLNITDTPSLNFRTHRKLLVVDGKVGFIGGVGIADVWSGNAQDEEHWRDNHYRVEGPAVSQIQAAFTDNWIDTTGLVFTGPEYLPENEPAGMVDAQVFMSSPESGGSRNMQLMYLLFIAGARESLWFTTPYFVLDGQSRQALIEAKQRGVDVKIIVPRKIDQPMVRHASRAFWGPLLEAGVELYEYQPTMIHTKLMIVDGLWVSIGSANLDNRSFKLNDEANLNVRDEEFARRQRENFENDLGNSQRVTLEQYESRPLPVKIWDHFASLFGPQM